MYEVEWEFRGGRGRARRQDPVGEQHQFGPEHVVRADAADALGERRAQDDQPLPEAGPGEWIPRGESPSAEYRLPARAVAPPASAQRRP